MNSGPKANAMSSDNEPFHLSRSSDGVNHWFSARDAAAGVVIPAKVRDQAAALVASLNRAFQHHLALSERHSHEALERVGLPEEIPPGVLETVCCAVVLGEDEDGNAVHLSEREARAAYDAIRAALSSSAPKEEAGWRPIETAPKDGTRILAVAPDGDGWLIGVAVWCKTPHVPIYGFHFTEGDPEDWDICRASHWMPLPTPPSASNDGDEK